MGRTKKEIHVKKNELNLYLSKIVEYEMKNMYSKILEKQKMEEVIINEDVINNIRKIIYEKITGEAYDKMFELKMKLLKKLKRLAKNNWINIVSKIELNGNEYKIILVGNGNTTINIIWNKDDDKFSIKSLSNVTSHDEYILKIQKFILSLLEERDQIIALLQEMDREIDNIDFNNSDEQDELVDNNENYSEDEDRNNFSDENNITIDDMEDNNIGHDENKILDLKDNNDNDGLDNNEEMQQDVEDNSKEYNSKENNSKEEIENENDKKENNKE